MPKNKNKKVFMVSLSYTARPSLKIKQQQKTPPFSMFIYLSHETMDSINAIQVTCP
jgi:hypothetical protein